MSFIRERVRLGPLTTLGVGGPARFFAEVRTERQLVDALSWAEQRSVPVEVMGGGSNLLVADRGFDGLVIRLGIMGMSPAGPADPAGPVRIRVGGGHGWDAFVHVAVREGWAGLECLSGIPGAVGAAPIQNVGAYGQDVSETITSVRVVERSSGNPGTLSAADCDFAYRNSVFKTAARGRYVVSFVDFELQPGGAASVRYPELTRHLAAQQGDREPTLGEVRRAVIALRRRKSMVLDPRDANRRSAGSFFTNPVVEPAVLDGIRATTSGDVPAFDAGEGRVKLSAGWLIDHAGFSRGTAVGNVGTSTAHALALVNRGGATARDVVAFALRVRDGVRARFGVTLTPEPAWIGFSEGELRGW